MVNIIKSVCPKCGNDFDKNQKDKTAKCDKCLKVKKKIGIKNGKIC